MVVYLINPKDINNPVKLGNVSSTGKSDKEILEAACKLALTRYSSEYLQGKGLEVIEFGGKNRQYGAILK
jgi:hypothetical protein